MIVIRWSVCPRQVLPASLMFVNKAEAYPSKVSFRCCTLGLAPGLIHKHYISLDRPFMDKYSSLLPTFVNYDLKSFKTHGPDCDQSNCSKGTL